MAAHFHTIGGVLLRICLYVSNVETSQLLSSRSNRHVCVPGLHCDSSAGPRPCGRDVGVALSTQKASRRARTMSADEEATTLQFRPTYAVGGLCTPPPPRFAARYASVLSTRVSQPDFEAQIDALCGHLAQAHDGIRRARFVPLGLLMLGVVFLILEAVVAGGQAKGDGTPIWPVLVAVPLLAVGGIGLGIVYCRKQATMDACTERIRRHVQHLNVTTYRRVGLEWRVKTEAIIKGDGSRSIRLPVVELVVGVEPGPAYAHPAGGISFSDAAGSGGVAPQENDEDDTAMMLSRSPGGLDDYDDRI